MHLSRRQLGFVVASGLAALASWSSSAFAAGAVTIYTYHNHPPFVVEAGRGLSYELADYLNRKAKGSATFKIEVVTRAQLDKLLAAPDFQGVVAERAGLTPPRPGAARHQNPVGAEGA